MIPLNLKSQLEFSHLEVVKSTAALGGVVPLEGSLLGEVDRFHFFQRAVDGPVELYSRLGVVLLPYGVDHEVPMGRFPAEAGCLLGYDELLELDVVAFVILGGTGVVVVYFENLLFPVDAPVEKLSHVSTSKLLALLPDDADPFEIGHELGLEHDLVA